MIKYGAPTMVEMENLRQGAEVCRSLNLDFLELNINFPQYLLTALDAEELRTIAEEYGIFYTLHLDDEMSIADFNPYIADGYCRTVYDAIELSKKLGIRKLNMHLSVHLEASPQSMVNFLLWYSRDMPGRYATGSYLHAILSRPIRSAILTQQSFTSALNGTLGSISLP